jgi:hypothetical protein
VTAGVQSFRRIIASVIVTLAVVLGGGACGRSESAGSAATTTSSTAPTNRSVSPLSAPTVSAKQDARFLTGVTEADPALATYEQDEGNVALRALLTDGSAFCAFLHQGGGIDNALVSVAIGARSVEAQTHLPSTVTTFNTIEAVALVTLCPNYQTLLPVADRSKIRSLGVALSKQAG